VVQAQDVQGPTPGSKHFGGPHRDEETQPEFEYVFHHRSMTAWIVPRTVAGGQQSSGELAADGIRLLK
jgi:hypothetical protein